MLHAKAQKLLAQIYHGRLQSNEAPEVEWSDIAMEPMAKNEIGKSSRLGGKAPFEMIPEDRLDFAYYKNRDDFGEGHGGGEIFGRPLDMVSERSQTPRSFAGGHESQSSSRAPSPAPGHTGRYELSGTTYPAKYHHPVHGEPIYDDSVDLGVGPGMYRHANESESRLLAGAQAMPVTTSGEQFGVDRWRMGFSGNGPGKSTERSMPYDHVRLGRS